MSQVQRDHDNFNDPVAVQSEDVLAGEDDSVAAGGQVGQDEKDALDTNNIIDERTRGAAKSAETYREPGDEEGLPGAEDGTSSGRQ